jgi:hypothetical protein
VARRVVANRGARSRTRTGTDLSVRGIFKSQDIRTYEHLSHTSAHISKVFRSGVVPFIFAPFASLVTTQSQFSHKNENRQSVDGAYADFQLHPHGDYPQRYLADRRCWCWVCAMGRSEHEPAKEKSRKRS